MAIRKFDPYNSQPPPNEVDRKLATAEEKGLGPKETIQFLKNERKKFMVALVELLQYSCSLNPELQDLFRLITGGANHVEIKRAIDEIHDFPNVEGAMEALEYGFSKSGESSVTTPILERYRQAMDNLYDAKD